MDLDSRTETDELAEETFLAEIRNLRCGRSKEDEDWTDRAIDMRTAQLLDLSESLRNLEIAPELLDVRKECDEMVDKIVTGRLEGMMAIDQIENFLCRTASLLLERAMCNIEE